ncbi:hypothetical protein [Marinicellulosiphila megalodicopiae]|uniref:hypothetical protein n=1 Tax=Marinicellulosiphila megalodicopiae TaxID=2724896 RepID=UPI003BAFB140
MKYYNPILNLLFIILGVSLAPIVCAEVDEFDQWEEWISEDLFDQGELQDFDELQLYELDNSDIHRLPKLDKPLKNDDQVWLQDLWEIENSHWEQNIQLTDEQREFYEQWLDHKKDGSEYTPDQLDWLEQVELDDDAEHNKFDRPNHDHKPHDHHNPDDYDKPSFNELPKPFDLDDAPQFDELLPPPFMPLPFMPPFEFEDFNPENFQDEDDHRSDDDDD